MKKEQIMIVRNNKFVFSALVISFVAFIIWFSFGPYEKTRFAFDENFYVALFFSIGFIWGTLYSLYKLFDNRPVIILSANGIWTKKTGEVLWKDITSYNSNISKAEHFDSTSFSFKISGQNKMISIGTTFLDADVEEIIEFVKRTTANTETLNSKDDKL